MLSLCLSRACLGKTIILAKQSGQKVTFWSEKVTFWSERCLTWTDRLRPIHAIVRGVTEANKGANLDRERVRLGGEPQAIRPRPENNKQKRDDTAASFVCDVSIQYYLKPSEPMALPRQAQDKHR